MAPAKRCIPAGRSFFVKPPTIIDLGEGMEMYNGFYQSAIRGWQPFLNVDVAHKAFPRSIPVTEALIELFNSRWQQFTPRDLERGLDGRQIETFQKFMRQLRVIYQVPTIPSSKRVFRVNGVKTSAREKTFKLDDGRSMTIEQYFATEKRYRLKYPLLPTLWVGATQREILIPLELCTIMEGKHIQLIIFQHKSLDLNLLFNIRSNYLSLYAHCIQWVISKKVTNNKLPHQSQNSSDLYIVGMSNLRK